MYILMRSMGVSGLFLIMMAYRYGEMELGVGILVMFSLECMVFGIMVRMPPLALLVSEYLLCFCVILFELLYMI